MTFDTSFPVDAASQSDKKQIWGEFVSNAALQDGSCSVSTNLRDLGDLESPVSRLISYGIDQTVRMYLKYWNTWSNPN